MCRNITELRGLEPPATSVEIEAASRQYVRKVAASRSRRLRVSKHSNSPSNGSPPRPRSCCKLCHPGVDHQDGPRRCGGLRCKRGLQRRRHARVSQPGEFGEFDSEQPCGVVVQYASNPVVAQSEGRDGLQCTRVGVRDVRKDRSPTRCDRRARSACASNPTGKGELSSANAVNAMVVSRWTLPYVSASSRKSSYSGIPMWAMIRGSRGKRCSSAAIGSRTGVSSRCRSGPAVDHHRYAGVRNGAPDIVE